MSKLDKYYEALDCILITSCLALSLGMIVGMVWGVLAMSGVVM